MIAADIPGFEISFSYPPFVISLVYAGPFVPLFRTFFSKALDLTTVTTSR